MKLVAKHVSQEMTPTVRFDLAKRDRFVSHAWIRRPGKDIYCLSSSFGCPNQCVFCASGQNYHGMLSADDILESIEIMARSQGEPPAEMLVSFMGCGEPFMNAYEICEAAEVFITTSRAARIALSTCAPNNCFHYAHLFAQYPKMHGAKLQISFPVADDTLRRQLIPVASPSHEVAALASLWKKSMGPVELNCVLLDGVNDADSHARQLADFAKAFDLPVKINQYHDVELGYRQSRRRMSFVRTMWRHGIKPELYRTDGADVGAGCGQLRSAAIEP